MNKKKISQPRIRPVDPGVIPDPVILSLRNGVPVFLIEAGTEDIERLEFTFAAGNVKEKLPLLASTVNMMLSEGSLKNSSEKINSLMDFYGAFYQLYSDRDRAGIVIYCMNKYLEKILKLTREIMFSPAFPEAELSNLMNKRFRSYQISRDKVNTLATDQFFESIFGNHHPYGRQTHPEDFNNLIPANLKDFHSKYYTVENMAIIVSGKIHKNIIELLNHFFSGIHSYCLPGEEPVNLPASQAREKVHIKKTGALQTAIKIGSSSINKRHPDYPALKILNVILGGYFGSRLMKNIREEKGYTYGVSSNVTSLNLSGYKFISTEVSKINTQNTIEEIYKEIRLLQTKPVEKEELSIVRNYMLGEMVRMFDGPFAIAESFRSVWEFGLDNLYYYHLAEKIKSIVPDEITSIANTYYKIDDLYEITAG